MNQGAIVEIANSDDIYRNPREPYTQRLLASIPKGWHAGQVPAGPGNKKDPLPGSPFFVPMREIGCPRAHANTDAVAFGHEALVDHLLPFDQAGDEAMVRRSAHAVVVQAIDRNGFRGTGAGRVRQHRVEELVVFQAPVRELGDRRFAAKAMRRIEVRALRRKMIVEETTDGDRHCGRANVYIRIE